MAGTWKKPAAAGSSGPGVLLLRVAGPQVVGHQPRDVVGLAGGEPHQRDRAGCGGRRRPALPRCDPQVGPLVVIGVGGVLAEIYKDFAMRLAPVTPETALQMIEEVKGLAVIRGYRGMTKGDCKALAEAVAAFSQLAAFDDIAEAEINPLIVRKEGEGVVAVDGLIVRN